MRKKISLLLLICLLLFCTAGCTEEGRENYEVILSGDVDSGYEWQCEQDPDGIVEVIKNEYIEAEEEGEEGKYSFVFAGKSKGKTELTFQYIDEETNRAIKTVKIWLRVKADRSIIEEGIQNTDEDLKIEIQ